jgi:hypothetical protein
LLKEFSDLFFDLMKFHWTKPVDRSERRLVARFQGDCVCDIARRWKGCARLCDVLEFFEKALHRWGRGIGMFVFRGGTNSHLKCAHLVRGAIKAGHLGRVEKRGWL